MKRHFDLIKSILKYVEKNGKYADTFAMSLPEFPPYSDEEVQYNAYLCVDAGFIVGQNRMTGIYVRYLTWKGQEELERLRNIC